MKYISPTKPMKHQVEARRRLGKRPREPSSEDVMAWLMDRGTGKTKVILDEWQERIAELDLLVVVAPAGSYKNWFQDKSDEQLSEIEAHLDPRLFRKLRWAAWTGGADSRRRREALLTARGPRAFFVNVEAFSGSSRKRGPGKAERYVASLLKTGRAMLVVDESTTVRARRSNRTAAVMRLRELAPVRRIMSGLVTPKNPMDLFMQFYFLDWRILGFDSHVAFRTRHAITEKRCFMPNDLLREKLRRAWNNPSVDVMTRDMLLDELEQRRVYVPVVVMIKGFRRVEELQEKIAPYSYRVLKDDCLDLAKKIYMTRDVELTDEQERLYRELRDTATAELDGKHVVSTVVVAKMMRMHQILCGHVRDENDELLEVKSNRVDALMNVIDDHSGKAVIWSCYRPEVYKIVEAISKEYGSEAVAQYHGGNRGSRDAEERRFLSDAECRFMVSTQATGGKGNTWTVANLVVYSSNSYDLEHREQSEDRTHRKGQKRPVTYVDLTARGTVDEKIIRALRAKIDLFTSITGETYREWLV